MGFQVRVLIAVLLLLALPLSVSLLTWQGLERMDLGLQQVAEEFSETRSLHPVDNELSVALFALQQGTPEMDEKALSSLKQAEGSLIQYLADQYNDVSDKEHQAQESGQASAVLLEIRDLVGPAWADLSRSDRMTRTLTIREGVRELYIDAEEGVLDAPRQSRSARRQTLGYVVSASLLFAAISIAFLLWSSRAIHRRLSELRDSMASDAENTKLAEARDVPGMVSQIEELNRRLHGKIEEKERELLKRERMAGIGLLAADVAHEINNPLNAMLGLSELSIRTASEPVDEQSRTELHESLTVIRREVLRCRGIVQRLMAMVRGTKPPQWVDVNRLLSESVDVARAARPDRAHCYVVGESEHSVSLFTSSEELRQIILTLLINAADAVPNDGRIEVDILKNDREILLRVRDNGRGFTAETQSNFSVPFSTTRQAEGGTGLGLSIAYAIAADIGAEIRAESEGPGKGSQFLVAFPAKESK